MDEGVKVHMFYIETKKIDAQQFIQTVQALAQQDAYFIYFESVQKARLAKLTIEIADYIEQNTLYVKFVRIFNQDSEVKMRVLQNGIRAVTISKQQTETALQLEEQREVLLNKNYTHGFSTLSLSILSHAQHGKFEKWNEVQ